MQIKLRFKGGHIRQLAPHFVQIRKKHRFHN